MATCPAGMAGTAVVTSVDRGQKHTPPVEVAFFSRLHLPMQIGSQITSSTNTGWCHCHGVECNVWCKFGDIMQSRVGGTWRKQQRPGMQLRMGACACTAVQYVRMHVRCFRTPTGQDRRLLVGHHFWVGNIALCGAIRPCAVCPGSAVMTCRPEGYCGVHPWLLLWTCRGCCICCIRGILKGRW